MVPDRGRPRHAPAGRGPPVSRSGKARAKAAAKPDPATQAFAEGLALVKQNPALGALDGKICREAGCPQSPDGGLATITSNGVVHVHPTRRAEPREWAWTIAHALLHLGFGHVPAAKDENRIQPDPFDLAARCTVVNRFLLTFPVGRAPDHLPADYPGGDEDELAARWRRDGIPAAYEHCGTAGRAPDQILTTWRAWGGTAVPDWQTAFAAALTRSVSAAMDVAGGRRDRTTGERLAQRPWDRALNWFVSSYPLLGGLAAGLTVVADAELARAQDIAVAAVSATAGEIYINPLRTFADDEWRFILAHEMLHAALRHGERRGGRDPYLHNVAADYVVNDWLVEMRIGSMPEGLLHDPALRGLSVEEVYDRIATDLRRMRRLATLRGKGAGDILGEPLAHGAGRPYADLDEFYRRGLVQGFDLHVRDGRGLLPAGLVQEIRALAHPPVPWDARLARWFDEYVPRPEAVRSYARPARRQASTPDIPRAGRYFPPEETARCTFGVVLDTSGSMNAALLGKALGAIASYAEARDVPAARVVFCDAAPYDAGYVPPTEIAGRVRVRGRGGTVLQPGIDLLQRAEDFPPAAPLLVITDGWCDTLRIRREHAYLIPQGASLPFTPKGPVFRLS
ncbi:vWA domain-containing protein [Streptomyces erythrochromogenes]|uniref:vWA domain-containing protein n=1 Tax=Streptomyces erythrochromogenes TaxID=285574 RepID=UPI0038177363